MLITQIHNDVKKASAWYKPEDFIASILHGADPSLIREYAAGIAELTAHPHLFGDDEKTIDICRRWDLFCTDLFHSYQDLALAEVEGGN